jgi:hypothetical protein
MRQHSFVPVLIFTWTPHVARSPSHVGVCITRIWTLMLISSFVTQLLAADLLLQLSVPYIGGGGILLKFSGMRLAIIARFKQVRKRGAHYADRPNA